MNPKANSQQIREHVESRIGRIVSQENDIHAFVEDTFSEKLIQDQVSQLLSDQGDGEPNSPLSGYLLGVKDIIRVDPFPTRCGSVLPEHLFAGEEASCVSAMRKAGCIVAGKMVSTEFAIWHPGKTRNPCNLAHTPGGSSSGSAAAVSAGFVDIAFGSQTNGSVIRPAAFCGVIGFKPSYGRIPLDGVVPFCPSTDHLGIFVSKLGLLDSVMARLVSDWRTEVPVDNELVLGIPTGAYLEQARPDALASFADTVASFRHNGVRVVEIPYLNDLDLFRTDFEGLIYGELARVHEEWFEKYGNLYSSRTAECVAAGRAVSDKALEGFRQKQEQFVDDATQKMQHEKIDAWIAPSALGTAPLGIKQTGLPSMNSVWSYSRLPTISMKSGVNEKLGLPYGVQVIGRAGEDERLLRISERLESPIGSH